MENIMEVRGLQKSYGPVHAVRGIDFDVEKGKLFAFLGPNGAGKSTTIAMLCTLLRPDAGAVTIGGRRLGTDDDAIRAQIGVVFQDSVLDRLLTVRENLQTRSRFYPGDAKARAAAIDAAIEATGIGEFLDRRYGKLSGGQRRRADIARAMVNTPSLLFLDEPTTGLDPQTRRSVWQTIREIQLTRGMTVFFSTHYMEEAAGADHVIIIDHGQIAASGTPQALRETYAQNTLRLYAQDEGALLALLHEKNIQWATCEGGVITLPAPDMPATLALFAATAPHLYDFEAVRGTMDDVFIRITGEEVRDV